MPSNDWSDSNSTTTWTVWTTSGTADGYTVTSNSIWADWTSAATSSGSTYYHVGGYETSEEWRQANEARERERAEARERADRLLREHLSAEQLAEYEEHGHFHLETDTRRYRIRRGRVANIDALAPDGRVEHRLCVHPAADVPDEDTMLAQKLALETAETELLRLANRHAA